MVVILHTILQSGRTNVEIVCNVTYWGEWGCPTRLGQRPLTLATTLRVEHIEPVRDMNLHHCVEYFFFSFMTSLKSNSWGVLTTHTITE
jgi:hypothetical protein